MENTELAEAQPQHVEATPVEAGALEAMERATVDLQIATAHRYPRDITQFQRRSKELATIDRATAESCIYHRPVGKDRNGQPIFATGESIRLAEIVCSSYGNLRVATQITEMTPRYVKAMGVAWDLETNCAARAEVVESTVRRDKSPYDERMRLVIAKAAQSKARRDAIFAVVPKGILKPVLASIHKVIQGDEKTFSARREAMLEWCKSIGISPDRVFRALRVKGLASLDTEKFLILGGLKTAIEMGDILPEEAFPPIGDEPEPPKTGVEAAKQAVKKRHGRPPKQKPAEEPKEDPEPPEAPQPEAEPQYACTNGNCPQAGVVMTSTELTKSGKCPHCLAAVKEI